MLSIVTVLLVAVVAPGGGGEEVDAGEEEEWEQVLSMAHVEALVCVARSAATPAVDRRRSPGLAVLNYSNRLSRSRVHARRRRRDVIDDAPQARNGRDQWWRQQLDTRLTLTRCLAPCPRLVR